MAAQMGVFGPDSLAQASESDALSPFIIQPNRHTYNKPRLTTILGFTQLFEA
jgi:hypothetical protein